MIDDNENKTIPNDLNTMLKSIPLAEQIHSKLEIVNNIHSQIKLLGEGNSFLEINIELFKEFAQQIRKGRSEVEKGLLNVVLTITELGSDIVEQLQENKFFQIFKDSGLMKKIEEILQLELSENEKGDNSQLNLQIVQIISFINKYQENESYICDQYGQILQCHLIKFIDKIKELSDEQKTNGKQIKEENNIIQKEFRNGIRTIKSIYCLVEHYENKKILVDDLKIHETISPLIHLNCNPSLNCSQCIILPENDLINELHGAALRALSELIGLGNNVDKYLQDNHSAYNHIIPIILSFTENISDQIKEECKYQSQSSLKQDFSHQYQIVVDGSLNILYYLLFYNSPLCQQAGSNSFFLSSLFKLIRYKRQRIGRIKVMFKQLILEKIVIIV